MDNLKIIGATRNLLQEISDLADSGVVFSDVMVDEDSPIKIRTPAGWSKTDMAPASYLDIEKVAKAINSDWEHHLRETGAVNALIAKDHWRFRISVYSTSTGSKKTMVIRKIPLEPPKIDDIGLNSAVYSMLRNRDGLILINGATGSGKSTTLASLVEYINNNREAHVITIEDPTEFEYQWKKAIFSQREVGVDVPSFFEGVRAAMRARPDVLVIGEIRDKDTAETAILAAESGLLVIGTIHANSAINAVQKYLSFFDGEDRQAKLQILSTVLVGVISQILLPHKNGKEWVLAAEILFNGDGRLTSVLDNVAQFKNVFSDDKISITMVDAMVKLTKDQLTEPADALRMINSENRATLSSRLNSIKK